MYGYFMLVASLVMVLSSQPVANPVAEFDLGPKGRFEVELFMDKAPRTAGHIKMLIDKGFYNGILFHRRVPGFVVQTGDPESKKWTTEEARAKPGEMGGTEGLGEATYGKPIKFEKNDLSHVKGTLGIALESPGDDSGDSQIFINLADNKRLDGKYVVFGRVTKGMDVVMKTMRGDLIHSVKMVED